MKILLLLFVNLISVACSVHQASNIVPEKIENSELQGFYRNREESSFSYLLRELYRESKFFDWYMGDNPVQIVNTGSWPDLVLKIEKNGIIYEQQRNELGYTYSSTNNAFHVFKIGVGTGTGNFVVLSAEATPILGIDSGFLLVSKQQFTTLEQAYTFANSLEIRIPQLEATTSTLDLIYNENKVKVEYENLEQQAQKIQENFTIIEFFGIRDISNKLENLNVLNYNPF